MSLSGESRSIFEVQEGDSKYMGTLESKEERRAMWSKLVAESQQFKGTTSEYCKSKGISYACLKYWRRLLGPSVTKASGEMRAKQVQSQSPFVHIKQVEPPPLRNTLEGLPSGHFSGARFVAEVLFIMAELKGSQR